MPNELALKLSLSGAAEIAKQLAEMQNRAKAAAAELARSVRAAGGSAAAPDTTAERAAFERRLEDARAFGNERAQLELEMHRNLAAIDEQAAAAGLEQTEQHAEAMSLAFGQYIAAVQGVAAEEASAQDDKKQAYQSALASAQSHLSDLAGAYHSAYAEQQALDEAAKEAGMEADADYLEAREAMAEEVADAEAKMNSPIHQGIELLQKYAGYAVGAAAAIGAVWAAARQGAVLNQQSAAVAKYGLEIDKLREATSNAVDDGVLSSASVAMARSGLTATQVTKNLTAAMIIATEQGEDFERVAEAVAGAFRGESDQLQNLGVQLEEGKTLQDDYAAAMRAVDETIRAGGMSAADGAAFYDQFAQAAARAGGEVLKLLDNIIRFQRSSTASSDLERGRDQVQEYGVQILDAAANVQNLERALENLRGEANATVSDFEALEAGLRKNQNEMERLVNAQQAVQRGIDAIQQKTTEAAEKRLAESMRLQQQDAVASFEAMLDDLSAYGDERAAAVLTNEREIAAINDAAQKAGTYDSAEHWRVLELSRRKHAATMLAIAQRQSEEVRRAEESRQSLVREVAQAEREALPEYERTMLGFEDKVREFANRVAKAGFAPEAGATLVAQYEDLTRQARDAFAANAAREAAERDAAETERVNAEQESAEKRYLDFQRQLQMTAVQNDAVLLLDATHAEELDALEAEARATGLLDTALYNQARLALIDEYNAQRAEKVAAAQEEALSTEAQFAIDSAMQQAEMLDTLARGEPFLQAAGQLWAQFWADLAAGASGADILRNAGKIIGGMIQQIGTMLLTAGTAFAMLAPFMALPGPHQIFAGSVAAAPALIAGGLLLTAAGAAIGGALGSSGGGKSASGGAGGSAPGLGGNVGFRPPQREEPRTIIIQVDGRGSLDTSDSIAEKVAMAMRRGVELGFRMA